MPAGVSAVRGPGLPCHGSGDTPLVQMAPIWLTS